MLHAFYTIYALHAIYHICCIMYYTPCIICHIIYTKCYIIYVIDFTCSYPNEIVSEQFNTICLAMDCFAPIFSALPILADVVTSTDLSQASWRP